MEIITRAGPQLQHRGGDRRLEYARGDPGNQRTRGEHRLRIDVFGRNPQVPQIESELSTEERWHYKE